jgi:hypothetical protein
VLVIDLDLHVQGLSLGETTGGADVQAFVRLPPSADELIYLVLTRLVAWIVLLIRPETADQVKILVLRHRFAVLGRSTPPPIRWAD